MGARGEAGTGNADKAVLIMGDSLGVMRDIETVWRAGTLDELRLRHRRAMVEDIVRLRRSMRGGGVSLGEGACGGVLQRVRGHYCKSEPG